MKLIPLTHGLFAKVDDSDYDDLVQFNWREQQGYAVRSLPRSGGPRKIERMHRRLLGLAEDDVRDGEHEDGDRANNQRYNIRVATRSQNVQNVGLRANNTSGYKGVSRKGNRWAAQINTGKCPHYLGSFATPQDASEFYQLAVAMCHGEFANVG